MCNTSIVHIVAQLLQSAINLLSKIQLVHLLPFQDGLAEISLDADELPVIKPTIYGMDGTFEGRERELQNLPRRQVVNHITMEQWRTIIKTFRIVKSRIPPRNPPSEDEESTPAS